MYQYHKIESVIRIKELLRVVLKEKVGNNKVIRGWGTTLTYTTYTNLGMCSIGKMIEEKDFSVEHSFGGIDIEKGKCAHETHLYWDIIHQ